MKRLFDADKSFTSYNINTYTLSHTFAHTRKKNNERESYWSARIVWMGQSFFVHSSSSIGHVLNSESSYLNIYMMRVHVAAISRVSVRVWVSECAKEGERFSRAI